MQFEWDEEKSEETRALRGFGFEDVATAFLDPFRFTFCDDRFEYGEERWITFGEIENRLFAIAYTMRGHSIRIISARKANRKERTRYDENKDIQA